MEMNEFSAVGVAGSASLAVLALVGRQSYRRKVVQLSKDLEKNSMGPLNGRTPTKVWAVLTPQETIKVFLLPLAVVISGTTLLGTGFKQLYGIRDLREGLDTLRWVARTGPPPS